MRWIIKNFFKRENKMVIKGVYIVDFYFGVIIYSCEILDGFGLCVYDFFKIFDRIL